MKDLKHLIYFENLLQDAHNELVAQAVQEGDYALGYSCYYIPEVLLNLPGCFSSRLRAPRCTSTDIASYYMTNRTCPYARSLLERAIEGGYNYLNALLGAECCATMERMEEHFFLINPVKNEKFFVTQIDPPMKGDETNLDYYKAQLKLKVVDKLHEEYGIDTSEEAMRRPFAVLAFVFAAFSCVLSNVGLDVILMFSVPMLNALYPVAIVLVLMGLVHGFCDAHPQVWVWVGGVVAVQSVITSVRDAFFAGAWLPFDALPLADIGAAWAPVAVVAFVIGLLHSRFVAHSRS